MKTALLIHGAFGSPEENWFPWLKEHLAAAGFKVIVPTFPTPENQNLITWEAIVEPYVASLNKDSIIVGHSLGVPFGLRVLELIKQPIAGFYAAAGFVELLKNDTFDAINHTFTQRRFNWKEINQKSCNFYVYHSQNDPYVSWGCAKNLAGYLNVEITEIPNGGHLNEGMGFTEFSQLLSDIYNA